MRNNALLITALSSTALLLRRSRRFGPLKAIVLGALLEEVVRRLRAQEENQVTASKPSLWQRLTKLKTSSQMRAPQ